MAVLSSRGRCGRGGQLASMSTYACQPVACVGDGEVHNQRWIVRERRCARIDDRSARMA